MEFKDRVSNKPNRVKLTYDEGGASTYATVELADEPIEEGTPLNALNMNKLLNKEDNDYIVEQGTSGNWTYRKWNSGIAECWFYGSIKIEIIRDTNGNPLATGITNILIGSTRLETPIIFASKEYMICTASCNWNFTEWVDAEPVSTNEVQIRKFGNDNSFGYKNGVLPDTHYQIVSVCVKGRWK